MKPKGPKHDSRVKTKARRQFGKDPSEREVRDYIVRVLETTLSQHLEQIGFSKREAKDLAAGSKKTLTAAVREKLAR